MPSTRRRSRQEIYIELLEQIQSNDPMKPTRLMYAAVLSWKMCVHMCGNLESEGLIEKVSLEPDKRTSYMWSITPEGSSFLRDVRQAYRNISKIDFPPMPE